MKRNGCSDPHGSKNIIRCSFVWLDLSNVLWGVLVLKKNRFGRTGHLEESALFGMPAGSGSLGK